MTYAYGVTPARIKAHMAKANAQEADLSGNTVTISSAPSRRDAKVSGPVAGYNPT